MMSFVLPMGKYISVELMVKAQVFELLSKPSVSMYSKIHVQIWLCREDHIRRFKKTMTMGEEALKVYQSSFKSIYLCQVNQKGFPLHGKTSSINLFFLWNFFGHI